MGWCVHILLLAALSATPVTETNRVLRTAAELYEFQATEQQGALPFDVEGRIRSAGTHFILEDSTGRTWITGIESAKPESCSNVRLKGYAHFHNPLEATVVATSVVVLGSTRLQPPIDIALDQILSRQLNLAIVRTSGTVVDAFEDEVDAACMVLVLKDGPTRLPVSILRNDHPDAMCLLDAKVEVTGTLFRSTRGYRKYSGPIISASALNVLAPPPDDPFAAPSLKSVWYDLTPSEIAALDRRSTTGEVLAAWKGKHILLRDDSFRIIKVKVFQDGSPPSVGDRIDVVGYPQTDLFGINLSNARWRASRSSVQSVCNAADARPRSVTIKTLMFDRYARRRINASLHGELVRLRGTVRDLHSGAALGDQLVLDCDGLAVPVECGSATNALNAVEVGSEIEITGRCLVETGVPNPFDVFPHATGFTIILRSADDIRVLKNPPWLTPFRFWTILVALLCVLAAIVLWNLTLHTLVKRRARQLYKSDLARATSELRIEDRTHLAAELHDSLSQNLTGIAMEIETATRIGVRDPDNLMLHLGFADRVLKSCRSELRNSLWDLRNQALDEKDMGEAIRRTLLPHTKGVRLLVRFNVPRSRLTDTTTHEILRMIRELAVNGIIHGKATEIRIAGSLDRDQLLFSVADNGSGFDQDAAPGVMDGHFGLKGVRDRLKRLSGTMTLESAVGKGTKATVVIPLPRADEETR